MRLDLVDGTYELFRAHFGAPPALSPAGVEVGATLGLLRSLVGLLREPECACVAVAFDTVIESFRNQLFEGYKTAEGVPPELLAQFPLAERAALALGLVVWRMIDFEADDALATAASRFAQDPFITRIRICSPDKDLTQCVGGKVVTWDRRREISLDEAGVLAKHGVLPASIPDLLALVGDTADGIPGLPRWGEKSAATVLRRFGHLEQIPDDPADWHVPVRGAAALAASLAAGRSEALLYRTLATLRTDVPLPEKLADLRWRGPAAALETLCEELGETSVLERVPRYR